MSDQVRRIREILAYVCPFIPKAWFERREDVEAWVSAFRVYRGPLGGAFGRRPLVADFGQVRAVFLQWNAPYPRLHHNVIEDKKGQLKPEVEPLRWSRTGDGVLLLLITPLPENHDGNDEDAARSRVGFIRSIVVALMGRNAAYKQEFEINVHCFERVVGTGSPTFATPTFEAPKVDDSGVSLVGAALEKLSSLENLTQNRIRLALRWYQRSLGDDRLVRDTAEGQVDDFINSWLALETLAMEGTTNVARIVHMLAVIHETSAQRAGEMFPIGRIQRVHHNIVHEGRIESLKDGLTRFMIDIFADLLLHILGLPSGDNTRRYLDGSARELV